MRIVTLVENSTCEQTLACEHGLSLYIETCGKKILFDAGQSDLFAQNAEKLGIDLREVDFAILSHGHYDHGGGLDVFFKYNKTAPVYLHHCAFEPHYNAIEKDIGLDSNLKQNDRLVFTDKDVQIAPGITLRMGAIRIPSRPVESFGLSMMEAGKLCPEDFRHEQYLLVEENGKTICISGCSHCGILNIMDWFKPDVLVGGFHFMKLDPCGDGALMLREAAQELLGYNTVYYTGHCTGEAQFDFLKQTMGDRLQGLSTGIEIKI